MKLSEAIRKGATLRPRAHGNYFVALEVGGIGSCALGAAWEAVHGDMVCAQGWLCKDFPILARPISDFPNSMLTYCSCLCPPERDIHTLIWTLNDKIGCKRERIADIVEEFEDEWEACGGQEQPEVEETEAEEPIALPDDWPVKIEIETEVLTPELA